MFDSVDSVVVVFEEEIDYFDYFEYFEYFDLAVGTVDYFDFVVVAVVIVAADDNGYCKNCNYSENYELPGQGTHTVHHVGT